MQRLTALMGAILALFLALPLACGPTCPEAKTAMSDAEIAKDDALRVNAFVERRKSLVEGNSEEGYDAFQLQRVKFSVTAHELAIQIQLRIINLAESSELYEKNIEEINSTRCFLDDVLKAKVLNKDDATVSDRTGQDIQKKHALFKKLFGNNGEPSKYDLKDVYADGVKVVEPEAEKGESKGDDDESMLDGEEEKEEDLEDEEEEEEDDEGEKGDDLDMFD